MSLISVKNVVAPLSNPVHLVSILLLAILFGVYRLSGGSVTTGAPVPAQPEVEVNAEVDQLIPKSAAPAQRQPDAGKSAKGMNDIFDDINKSPAKAPQPAASKPQQSKSDAAKRSQSLNDIEKSLGLQ